MTPQSPCNPLPLPTRSRDNACTLHSLFVFSLMLCCTVFAAAQQPKTTPQVRDFGKVPLSFEPNRGQAEAGVRFLSRGQGYALYLNAGTAVLQLQKPTPASSKDSVAPVKFETSSLEMKLVGGRQDAAADAQDLLPGTVNYFTGNDPARWQKALPTYKRVAFRGVYPGVDLVYYGNQRELEYDFLVAPGADAAKIGLAFSGATPKIDAAGDLVLSVATGETRFHKPVVYQMAGDRRMPVEGRYQIADGKVGFALGSYDHTRALVIDPVLSYLTYLGGSSNDQIAGMAVDATGSVYVVGSAFSMNFPVTNAIQPSLSGSRIQSGHQSIFVSKFSPDGKSLIYSTYLDSTELTVGNGIAADSGGNAYVVGYTSYDGYPITAGAYQALCGGNYVVPPGATSAIRANGCVGSGQGDQGGVLTKLSPDGQSLVYSTYLSGNSGNNIKAVAVNASGEAYVAGVTNAHCGAGPYYPDPSHPNINSCQPWSNFPTTSNAVQSGTINTNDDNEGFITKFNAAGSALLYSTKFNNVDPAGHYVSNINVSAIALDAAGNAYVTGNVSSGVLIQTTTGVLETAPVANSSPAFVAKFNPAGTSDTSLVYATYLSGTTASNDIATGIAVDGAGNAIVTGHTNSCTFPTTPGAFSTVPGGFVSSNICSGGFLAKLNAAGSGLVWSTYTGNNGANNRNNDDNEAVALASDGSVYVVGDEDGVALSPTINPLMKQSESQFTYVKHFNAAGSAVIFSTPLGGTTDATSIPAAVALDPAGNLYVAGYTNSATYPVTADAVQRTNNGGGGYNNNGFVWKIAPAAGTTTALALQSGTIAIGQSVKLTATVTGQAGSIGVPTGTVTFLAGTTTLGTGTLDSSGTATFTTAALSSVTTYSLTASYPGDTAFSSSVSAAHNLVVDPLTPMVSLTAPATAVVGTSVSLATTVSGTGTTPTGTVTFKDGATTIGTATLASGAASISTTSLALGSHSITVAYSGDTTYASATSAASTVTINGAPSISFAAAPTSLTITHGTSGSVVITGTPVSGYTGTVTFACGTLPTAATCSFAPTTLAFTASSTAQSTTLTISTTTTSAAALEGPGFGKASSGLVLAALLMPFGWTLRRRKQAWRSSLILLALVCSSLAVFGLSGCGGTSSSPTKTPSTVTTPAGSYTVAVTITATGGNSTLNIPLTVQ